MFRKLYNAFAVSSIAVLLAGGGLIAYMFASGRLSPERIDRIAAVLRGEDLESGTSAENASDAEGDAIAANAASAEELRRRQREDQLRRALGERAYRDRMAQSQLLDQAIQYLLTEQDRFARDRRRWEDELKHRQAAVRDEGFEKELEIVKNLSPKIAKEHLIQKWQSSRVDAVRLLNGLDKNTVKRILGQMKTPEELQITHELLEQLGKDKAK